jgi:hypothetical protein
MYSTLYTSSARVYVLYKYCASRNILGVSRCEWAVQYQTLHRDCITPITAIRYSCRGSMMPRSTLSYKFSNVFLSCSSATAFSSSVPTVMRRHPWHPISLPRYRTTTPSSSASVRYTRYARVLSGPGTEPPSASTGIRMKFASCVPIARPRPSSFRLCKLERSLTRDALSVSIFSRIVLSDPGDRARSARWAVGVEMMYGALAFERTWISGG